MRGRRGAGRTALPSGLGVAPCSVYPCSVAPLPPFSLRCLCSALCCLPLRLYDVAAVRPMCTQLLWRPLAHTPCRCAVCLYHGRCRRRPCVGPRPPGVLQWHLGGPSPLLHVAVPCCLLCSSVLTSGYPCRYAVSQTLPLVARGTCRRSPVSCACAVTSSLFWWCPLSLCFGSAPFGCGFKWLQYKNPHRLRVWWGLGKGWGGKRCAPSAVRQVRAYARGTQRGQR